MSQATINFRSYASRETFRAVSFLASFVPSGDYVARTQIVGNSAEAIDLGDISGDPGLLWLRALDDDASVNIYQDAGATKLIGYVKDGMPMVFSPVGTIYAKNAGGNTTLEVIAFETVEDFTITHSVPSTGTGLYTSTVLTATVGTTTVNSSDEHTDSSVGSDLMEHVRLAVSLSTSQSIVSTPTYSGFLCATQVQAGTADSEIRISSGDATQFGTWPAAGGLLIGNFVRPAIYNGTEGITLDVYAVNL